MQNAQFPQSGTAAQPDPNVSESQKEELAQAVAKALNEQHRLPYYRKVCRLHDESVIKKVLTEVSMVPLSKIKKSKAALFAYLLKKHAQKQK